jgi:RHS repeat-associated protein
LSFDSFGNSSGSSRTRYSYTGRERDPDTGQLYYRSRFYDPQVGRFISEDPIGFEGGWNFYAYVGNNPTNWRDPLGLKQCKKKCGIKKAPYYGIDFGTGIIWGQSTLSGGQRFFWRAEFLNDATHDPKCCEVRQLISWNKPPFGPNTVPHGGFPSWVQPNTWIEDRDQDGLRYGRRSGPYYFHDIGNRYHGNEYFGSDRPTGFPQGTTFSFRLIVVDVCRGGKIIYRSKTLTVNF